MMTTKEILVLTISIIGILSAILIPMLVLIENKKEKKNE